MKKKIIITGGLGFIGTNLIKKLLKENFYIYNFDKLSKQSNLKFYFYKNKKYKFKKINLSTISIKKLTKILTEINPNYIINLASETHVDRSIDNPEKIIKSNISLITNLLCAIKNLAFKEKFNIKFIHIGTDEVYGDLSFAQNKIFQESSAIKPNNPYSASKAAQDHIIKAFSKTYGLKYIILNPSNNYGPHQFPEKFIPKSIINIMKGKSVEIYGKGKNMRNWIFVEDTVSAIFKIMRNGKFYNTYNVSSSNLISNKKLIDKIYDSMKIIKKQIEFITDRPGHDRKYFSDNKKLANLNWKEKYNLDQGILKTISWYKKIENLRQFNVKKINLKRLGKL